MIGFMKSHILQSQHIPFCPQMSRVMEGAEICVVTWDRSCGLRGQTYLSSYQDMVGCIQFDTKSSHNSTVPDTCGEWVLLVPENDDLMSEKY